MIEKAEVKKQKRKEILQTLFLHLFWCLMNKKEEKKEAPKEEKKKDQPIKKMIG